MKIDIQKIKKEGGKLIEFDPTKAYMVVVDEDKISKKDFFALVAALGNDKSFGVTVVGDVDKAVALYEVKK